jgi:hypothetical protein
MDGHAKIANENDINSCTAVVIMTVQSCMYVCMYWYKIK